MRLVARRVLKASCRVCAKSNTSNCFFFANFIKKNPPMLRALQCKDWAEFAKCYKRSYLYKKHI
ncbi:N-acetylmuramidase domain-containing protein [uncultured Bacteroides sp.]|uniref:N-acetylmuramidase domain-containing protein n=1 Tax=uncultured Bacteroides sp. TaxID=162156 RepID=UPI0032B14EA6